MSLKEWQSQLLCYFPSVLPTFANTSFIKPTFSKIAQRTSLVSLDFWKGETRSFKSGPHHHQKIVVRKHLQIRDMDQFSSSSNLVCAKKLTNYL